MASDEEIERRISRLEDDEDADETHEELAEYKRAAGEIHDELARRIDGVEENTPTRDELDAVLDRLDRIEERIDEIEAWL
jgi:uncharacterized coiled-coil DUF342 family protein